MLLSKPMVLGSARLWLSIPRRDLKQGLGLSHKRPQPPSLNCKSGPQADCRSYIGEKYMLKGIPIDKNCKVDTFLKRSHVEWIKDGSAANLNPNQPERGFVAEALERHERKIRRSRKVVVLAHVGHSGEAQRAAQNLALDEQCLVSVKAVPIKYLGR